MKFLILLIIVIGIYYLIKHLGKSSSSSTYNKPHSEDDDFRDSIPIANLPGPRLYALDIVGESKYQKELEAICGSRKEDGEEKLVQATLILEDNNPYDNQAVRVDIKGKTVGYLSRENARKYRQELKKTGYPNITATCSAMIVGGWDRSGGDRGHYGVKLDLPTDEDTTSSKSYVYSDGDTLITATVRTWEQSFTTKVVGVTHNNPDGSSRQVILSKCRESEKIILKRDPNNPYDKNAIGVFRENGEMMGYLEKDPILVDHIDKGGEVTARISQIIGGTEGKSYGCILKITKKDFDYKKISPYMDKSREIDNLIKKAQGKEKNNPDGAIADYKKAIKDIIVLDSEGSLARAWRYVGVPINRLTLLLERKKDYGECMKYLKWHESFDDRRGISNSDSESLKKRRERVEKKLSKKGTVLFKNYQHRHLTTGVATLQYSDLTLRSLHVPVLLLRLRLTLAVTGANPQRYRKL